MFLKDCLITTNAQEEKTHSFTTGKQKIKAASISSQIRTVIASIILHFFLTLKQNGVMMPENCI